MEWSKLGDQWKVPNLVANGRFQAWWPTEGSKFAWWPMEGSKFGGQWKVKEKHLFTSSHFPPNKLYLNLQFFPLTLRFYFTMILDYHSRLFFPFPRFINYDCCCNPTWRECEDEIHTPKIRTWESSGTLETLEFDHKGQNTSHWGVFYIIEKISKCRCLKWLTWVIWTSITQVMAKRRARSQIGNLTPDH